MTEKTIEQTIEQPVEKKPKPKPTGPFRWAVRGDGVAVIPDETGERTEGGVYLPDNAREKPLTGTIIGLGPLAGKENGPLAIGDVVAYGRYDGTELRVGHEGWPVVLLRDEHCRLMMTEGGL